MLTYTMDVDSSSIWLRTTPTAVALSQPYFVTEAGYFRAGSRFQTSRTGKESYLIFYTVAGEGELVQGEQRVTLGPGTALLIDCREPQRYGTAQTKKSWDHFWVHCDGPGVAALAQVLGAQGVLRPVPVAGVMRDRFERILSLLPRETTESALELSLSVHRILTRMATTLLQSSVPGEGSGGRRERSRQLIEESAEYIRAHFTQELDLQTLLDRVHLSRSYFMELFRRYIGTTPYNYLLSYRITQAKELLEITDLPVREIALRVGFSDESNFSTRFTRIAGETPRQYRKSAITGQMAPEEEAKPREEPAEGQERQEQETQQEQSGE